jgi:hypothetical protein
MPYATEGRSKQCDQKCFGKATQKFPKLTHYLATLIKVFASNISLRYFIEKFGLLFFPNGEVSLNPVTLLQVLVKGPRSCQNKLERSSIEFDITDYRYHRYYR